MILLRLIILCQKKFIMDGQNFVNVNFVVAERFRGKKGCGITKLLIGARHCFKALRSLALRLDDDAQNTIKFMFQLQRLGQSQKRLSFTTWCMYVKLETPRLRPFLLSLKKIGGRHAASVASKSNERV